VILAHHMGEDLIPTLVMGATTTGSAFLMVMRARLGRARDRVRLRRRRG
jgi:hypothetical protein